MVLPADAGSLDRWSHDNGLDAGRVRRLNPAFVDGRIVRADRAMRVLVPAASPSASALGAVTVADTGNAMSAEEVRSETTLPTTPPVDADVANPHTHTVSRGESAWKIAHRYRLSLSQLLARNGLDTHSRLQPGMVLKLDAGAGE